MLAELFVFVDILLIGGIALTTIGLGLTLIYEAIADSKHMWWIRNQWEEAVQHYDTQKQRILELEAEVDTLRAKQGIYR